MARADNIDIDLTGLRFEQKPIEHRKRPTVPESELPDPVVEMNTEDIDTLRKDRRALAERLEADPDFRKQYIESEAQRRVRMEQDTEIDRQLAEIKKALDSPVPALTAEPVDNCKTERLIYINNVQTLNIVFNQS